MRLIALLLSIPAAATAAPECKGVAPLAPKTVVATVGAEKVTLADLDTKVSDALCAARIEHAQKLHELRSAGLKNLLDERLIEAEAKRSGAKDGEAMMQAYFEREVPEPNADVVRGFYDSNMERMGGRPFEQMAPQIKNFLVQQAREAAYDRYVEQLRGAAKVTESLPPFRMEVNATGPAKGPDTAPITIVEFADFECGYCAKASETVAEVLKKYPGKIRLVFRDFPLGFHRNAIPAAIAARCAGLQGKYWEMHDALFGAGELNETVYGELATGIGLDATAFAACRADPSQIAAVNLDQAEGARAGVSGTPAFFINGIPLSGARPLADFTRIIDAELAR